MELNNWFNKGMNYDTYVAGMTCNRENMLAVQKKFTLKKEWREQAGTIKPLNLRAIALTEDWCGDAMVNNPILMTIAEYAGIEVRFLLRDQNLELMDQYLTNGTRSIPKYIFIKSDGSEYAVWGPRAPEIQAHIDGERGKLPPRDAPDFTAKQREMYGNLTRRFLEDKAWRDHIAEDILSALNKD